MSPVMVTGTSDSAGAQLVTALLPVDRSVRATVRSMGREADRSSFAAAGHTQKPGGTFTEAHWTDAELVQREGGATELVAVNPPFIAGPTSTTHLGSSIRLMQMTLEAPTEAAAGDDPLTPVVQNARAREEQGWQPRPTGTTIVESAECLHDLGFMEHAR